MKFQIKHRFNDSVLFELETESIMLCVKAAVKSGANLGGAYLGGADLRGADLRGANLRDAVGINRFLLDDLAMLRDQPGAIRAYKLVTADGVGPFNGGITYEVGKSYEAASNTDESVQCGAGINLATLPWCLKQWKDGYRILIAEFTAADIAAIPINTDGKFRVHRCAIVGEKSLAELDWPPKQPEE